MSSQGRMQKRDSVVLNSESSTNSKQVVSSPSMSSSNTGVLTGATIDKDIPKISLIITPLVKNKIEIDFSGKAIKEGLFSMWTHISEKKIQYNTVKELPIKLEAPDLPSTFKSPMVNSRAIQNPDDLAVIFELTHNCIFYSGTENSLVTKKDIVTQYNMFLTQMIKSDISNIKTVLNCLSETFGYYLDLARKEVEDGDSKNFSILIATCDRFLSETLAQLKDPMDFALSNLHKSFTTLLSDQVKQSKQSQSTSTIYNDTLQKINFILTVAVETLESIERSRLIKKTFRLDAYQEKILYNKCRAISSKEFFLAQMKHRKLTIDSHPYYSKDSFSSKDKFQLWKKQEESQIQKLSLLNTPKEEYLKNVWGIKTKEKEPLGVISIKVVQARELILKDENSTKKPDSFLEISYIHEKKRTRIISNSVNPQWKDHFSFQITKAHLAEEMEINIFGQKKGKDNHKDKDDELLFLGKCKFTTKDLMSYAKREVNWFPLQKRTSRSKVSGDLKLQFHYLPFPDTSTSPQNHIYYYKVLLEKLFESEYNSTTSPTLNNIEKKFKSPNMSSSQLNINTNNNNNSNSNNTTTTIGNSNNEILSSQALNLLKEYSRRYGILESTSKLYLMSQLIKYIIKEKSLYFIPEVRNILIFIIEIKFSHDQNILTLQEEKMFLEMVTSLSVICQTWLSYFHSTFPQNSPPGALRMLIDIYYLLKRSEIVSEPLVPLHDIVTTTYRQRYQQSLVMAKDLCQKQGISVVGKAPVLVRVCDILLYNLDQDRTYFSREFPPDSDLIRISTELYTKELISEIEELCQSGATSPQELSDHLELYFKLKETMSKFKDLSPHLVLVPIPELFKQTVMQWTLHCASQLRSLVDKLCANESWTPVSSDTLHSASVGEVFLGCYHALEVIKSLRWEDLSRVYTKQQHSEHYLFEIFSNFTMVASESIIYYTKVIGDISLNALDQAADDIFQLSESYSNDLSKTIQKVSLRFNNIQACLGHHDDLIQVLIHLMSHYKLSPAIVRETAKHTHLAIQNNVRTLIDRIYNRLSPVIVGEIYNLAGIQLDKNKVNFVVDFFQKIEKTVDNIAIQLNNNTLPPEVQLEPLLKYIASKLQIFSQFLYYPLVKQLLKRCYAGIINTLDEMIFPNNGSKLELTSTQLDMIESMIRLFGEFFYVDGEGLTQKAIDKQSERFMIIVLAYREAINSGVRDFDPLGLKKALANINFKNLKDLNILKKLNIKGLPKQLDVFSLIKKSIEKRQQSGGSTLKMLNIFNKK
ncbi:hypothetical protein DLAC_06943 [Tieghemostelium lacteum]|uniref:C2 domain-containing protein n=1 Tax=Tieghemostelium lacteum TaxID=361077 RepID=A0A151ZDY5_TIELA|nr:hypothetical protein DLAC_06943 [Tieghemostelium lacteum]|eukprot:KYQ92104.1 hypothetical protein DLAC_06943 [Tieghemostelium lacteum]